MQVASRLTLQHAHYDLPAQHERGCGAPQHLGRLCNRHPLLYGCEQDVPEGQVLHGLWNAGSLIVRIWGSMSIDRRSVFRAMIACFELREMASLR